MKPETKFRQNHVLPFLKTLLNTWYEPIQQMGISGSPDLLLCINGRFVALELKDVKGQTSKLQAFKLSEVRRANGVTFVASPLNWKEVRQQLSIMDSSKENAWKIQQQK